MKTPLPPVGNTPLIKVDGIYAKLECVNPTGSVKDRIAKYILEESERNGLLHKGKTIVEATRVRTSSNYCHAQKYERGKKTNYLRFGRGANPLFRRGKFRRSSQNQGFNGYGKKIF